MESMKNIVTIEIMKDKSSRDQKKNQLRNFLLMKMVIMMRNNQTVLLQVNIQVQVHTSQVLQETL